MRILKNKYLVLFLLLFFILLLAFIPFLKPVPEINIKNKLWTHKGYGDYNQYRIENILLANSKGFGGVELDLHFNSDSNDFFLCHAYTLENCQLKFSTIIDTLAIHKIKLWLDLKTMSGDYVVMIDRLNNIIDSSKIDKNSIIVEVKKIKLIRLLKHKGISAALWLKPMNDYNWFRKVIIVYKNNIKLLLCNPNAVAIPISEYNRIVKVLYQNQNIICWDNSYNCSNYAEYLKNKEIKIVLIDCKEINE